MIRYILSLMTFATTVAYGQKPVTIGFKLVNPEIISDTGAVRDQEEFIFSRNQKIQQLFKEYKVQEFKQLFPSAQNISHPKAKELLEYYYILSGADDAALLEDIMKRELEGYFKEVHVRDNPVHTIGEYIPNDPVDQSWNLNRILSVKAREAWAITKGSSDIKIAIIEVGSSGFQLTHEDLAGKIVYTNTVNDNVNVHGTYVAGCAAANTDNGIGISAIGFNSSLMLYKGSYNEILDAANRGADVINLSWISSCSHIPVNQTVINVATDLGAVIVGTPGNGFSNGVPVASCGGHGLAYPGAYNNVISVSSVSSSDKFESTWCCLNPCGYMMVHSHNSSVDIVAPGFCVYSTTAINNYDIWGTGTSFAAPIVAGAIALMKSINPCLNTSQADMMLKVSGEDISAIGNNASYYPPGQVPKKLNAYKAVLEAVKSVSIFFKNQNLTGTNTYQAYYGIYAGLHPDFPLTTGNTVVKNSANITFKAGHEIVLGPGFEVEPGGVFEAKSEVTNCY